MICYLVRVTLSLHGRITLTKILYELSGLADAGGLDLKLGYGRLWRSLVYLTAPLEKAFADKPGRSCKEQILPFTKKFGSVIQRKVKIAN